MSRSLQYAKVLESLLSSKNKHFLQSAHAISLPVQRVMSSAALASQWRSSFVMFGTFTPTELYLLVETGAVLITYPPIHQFQLE